MFFIKGKDTLDDYIQNSNFYLEKNEEEKKQIYEDLNLNQFETNNDNCLLIVLDEETEFNEIINKENLLENPRIEDFQTTEFFIRYFIIANNDFIYDLAVRKGFHSQLLLIKYMIQEGFKFYETEQQ
jgi:hypothetical protein